MGNTLLAVDLMIGLIDRAVAYSAVIQKARAENRDVTSAELDQLAAQDDVAREELRAAIEKAKKA